MDAICARISEYSNETLTRQSDKLNAFLGILPVFEMRGTCNCWGTPILHHLTDQFLTETSRWKMEMGTGFVRGLYWISVVGLWPSEDREPYLPSWSWTGRSRPVRFEYDAFAGFALLAAISVELCDGSSVGWEQCKLRYAEVNNPTHLSRFIRVRALTINIHRILRRHHQYTCIFQMNDGWFLCRYLIPTQEHRSKLNRVRPLYLVADSCWAVKVARFLLYSSRNSKQVDSRGSRVAGSKAPLVYY